LKARSHDRVGRQFRRRSRRGPAGSVWRQVYGRAESTSVGGRRVPIATALLAAEDVVVVPSDAREVTVEVKPAAVVGLSAGR